MSLAVADSPGWRDASRRRWGASLAVALAGHAVAAILLIHLVRAPVPPPPAPPPAMMVDLEPLPVPPAIIVPPPPPPPAPPSVAPPPPPPPLPPVAEAVVPLPPPKPVFHRRVPRPPPPRPVEAPAVAAPPSPPRAVATPAPAPPAPASVVPPSVLPSFRDLLAARLERYKRYPAIARQRGEEGVALIRFTLDRQGGVSDIKIARSSGHADLDEEVMALVRRAAPLPPIPASIPGATLDLIVPVRFSLR